MMAWKKLMGNAKMDLKSILRIYFRAMGVIGVAMFGSILLSGETLGVTDWFSQGLNVVFLVAFLAMIVRPELMLRLAGITK